MYTASILLSLLAAGAAFADTGNHSGYSKSTESCSLQGLRPILSCQCKSTDADMIPCDIALDDILANKNGELVYKFG